MIDCHIHFDERLVSAAGMVASMDAAGIERAALIAPLTDDIANTPMLRWGAPLLRRMIAGGARGPRRIVRKMYRGWVGRDGTVEVGGKRYEVRAQPDNEPIRRAVEAHPNRLWGWIFVNPRGGTRPTDEIERYASAPGMIGVKCHPYWHDCPIEELDDTAAYCEERELPMLIHLGTGVGGDYKRLPKRFPRLRIVYAHAGVPYQGAVSTYAHQERNVFIDLSSPGYVDVPIARLALANAGVRKCMFGSDGPYFHHHGDRLDYTPSLHIFDALGLRGEDRDRVARDNFLEFLGRESGKA